MGGYCFTNWFAMPWDPCFIAKFRPSIAYLELFAVTTAILMWIRQFQNRRVIIFTDNTGVRDMINSNSSGCKNCMVLIRILVLECLTWNVRVFARHVKTSHNGIADALSRFQWARFRKLTSDMSMNEFQTMMPDAIWPMSKVWMR